MLVEEDRVAGCWDTRLCVCVARSSMQSRDHFLLCRVLPFVSFIFAGGREGWGGVPANEDPFPILCKRTRCICAGPESGQLGDATTFISFRVTPFLAFGVTGPRPTPSWIISFVCLFVCQSRCLAYCGTKPLFHFIFTIFIITSILPGPLWR